MKHRISAGTALFTATASLPLLMGVFTLTWALESPGATAALKQANQLLRDGNIAEAAQMYRAVVRDERAESPQVVEALTNLQQCRGRLGQMAIDQIDDDLATAATHHSEDFRVLRIVASQLLNAVHMGTVVDGEFTRGYNYSNRGVAVTGAQVNVLEQDRLQALKWLRKAIDLAQEQAADETEFDELRLTLADGLLLARQGQQAWKLQALTDLSTDPDYTDLASSTNYVARYAPVDADGQPVLYRMPADWAAATNDGERLRWALAPTQKSVDSRQRFLCKWAEFLQSQFSVSTLQQDQWLFRAQPSTSDLATDSGEQATGVFAIHTLSEDETIARLASGVKRFTLPPEFNFIRIYESVVEAEQGGLRSTAARSVVLTFLNRRQYREAAERIERYLPLASGTIKAQLEQILADIRGTHFQFDPHPTQLAGQPARLSLIFRNAQQLDFVAHRVDVEKLLLDTKQRYRANPALRWFDEVKREHLPDLQAPASLFDDDQFSHYLVEQTAAWSETVEPRPNHWDRRVQIETPLTSAGLYLVEMRAANGNLRTRCLLNIADTVIVQKPLGEKWLYQVADAANGKPIVGANVEFFGVNRDEKRIHNFAARTDQQGAVQVALSHEAQWYTVARTPAGRLAWLGFDYFWERQFPNQQYGQLKAYGVSDRPLYRPGERVQAKFWVGYASYGDVAGPRVTNSPVTVRLIDPQGNTIAKQQVQSDGLGGCEVAFDIAASAQLGRYEFQVGVANQHTQTALSIRVEEYRKPEFEVNILAPEKPVSLGETIHARVEAKYYFGAPVTDAEVTIKVERTTFKREFYPVTPFDWCYGSGYWWFAEDYTWYPGFARWVGCFAPRPPYFSYMPEPPELVLERELQLDSTGVANVEIDTAVAKQLYGGQDHKYTISVEVRDASRRTITGEGSVIAAQEPFKIYTWTQRGHYQAGDRVDVNFQAQMLDGTPITGAEGTVDLLRITYDDNLQPLEQVVASFPAQTDEQGIGTQTMQAALAGQYRVRLRLRDQAGHEVEGAYVFTARGRGADRAQYRYNALELIPDKQHYSPGETVKLLIAANRADARVAVFLRAAGGAYQPPQWIELQDKSAIVEIPVAETDQPNFFVEAYTIYDGEYHQELREIFVPPAQRVVNVEVKTDKATYLPGEEAEVEVMVTDSEGRPAAGACLIAVYDRSLEQIADDVLPDDIRKFFWQWRRDHHPYRRVNLDVVQPSISIAGQANYPHLGIFGRSLADDLDAIENTDGAAVELASQVGAYGGGAYFGGGFRGGEPALAEGAMMMDAAPAPRKMARAAAAPVTGDAAAPTPQVRKDFADTALWLTNLETGVDGRAKTNFKMPENLTSWKIGSWSVGQGLRVGSGETTAVTRKPLLLRLQMPRFLVDRDEVVLSAIVHNDLPGQRSVQVSLEIDGETQLELVSESDRQQTVNIASHQQARVDWRCRATAEGLVTVRASAVTTDASDAMQLELPILTNGILKTDSFAGTVRAEQASSIVTVNVPQQRRIEQSRLTVRVSPSLAAAMIDALPYLNSYPYGCTEQTLNRFLPTVITQQTLRRMQIDLAQLNQRRNNLNAQELGSPEKRRQQWETHQRKQNGADGQAVYEAAVVDEMVTAGVTRLTAMQNPDGGWGWFSGTLETTTAHTTAVVIRGLLIAQENGVAIVPDVLQRGLAWLEQYQTSELQRLQNADGQVKPFKQHVDNVDALVFHVLALADRRQPAMQQVLFDQREHLTTYGKALLAWATHRLGNAQQTAMLRRNIEQFLVEDAENETAFLTNNGSWWYWYGSEIEANALYLKLLSAVDPQGRTAPRIVKWLLNNRKHATYWNSTRDTALVVEAFADYMAATEELQGDMAVEVFLSGRRLGRIEFTPENLFDVDNTIEISGAALPSGPQELEIRRTGKGNLYWSAYATNFTLQPEIQPAGLEVAVERRYYHLRPNTTQSMLPGARANVVDTRQSGFERVLLEDLQDIPSGELVEVELLITGKNDYEYLVIEDRKAAGLEAVDTQSGYFYTGGLLVYRELRDRHIGLCMRWLPQGKHSIRYQLRSEAPGTFTALPAVIQGMYSPELRGNSADYDLSIIE